VRKIYLPGFLTYSCPITYSLRWLGPEMSIFWHLHSCTPSSYMITFKYLTRRIIGASLAQALGSGTVQAWHRAEQIRKQATSLRAQNKCGRQMLASICTKFRVSVCLERLPSNTYYPLQTTVHCPSVWYASAVWGVLCACVVLWGMWFACVVALVV